MPASSARFLTNLTVLIDSASTLQKCASFRSVSELGSLTLCLKEAAALGGLGARSLGRSAAELAVPW